MMVLLRNPPMHFSTIVLFIAVPFAAFMFRLRSSPIRLEGVARAVAHDGAEAGKPQVRAGDRELGGGRMIEQASARRRRRLWIDVENERNVGPRHLDRGEVNDMAQPRKPLFARLDEHPVWPGVWPASSIA